MTGPGVPVQGRGYQDRGGAAGSEDVRRLATEVGLLQRRSNKVGAWAGPREGAASVTTTQNRLYVSLLEEPGQGDFVVDSLAIFAAADVSTYAAELGLYEMSASEVRRERWSANLRARTDFVGDGTGDGQMEVHRVDERYRGADSRIVLRPGNSLWLLALLVTSSDQAVVEGSSGLSDRFLAWELDGVTSLPGAIGYGTGDSPLSRSSTHCRIGALTRLARLLLP